MIKNNVLDELKKRGFIYKVSNILKLKKKIINNPITLYCGFDPTADSLHVGHLIPLFCLKWFQLYNNKVIVLIGGATGLIGDPSFKGKERVLNSYHKIYNCSKNIKHQILSFFNQSNSNIPIFLNNYDWFKEVNIISFLRDVGKFFSVNKMISKTFVKDRINKLDKGISFTEFSYNLLQSYDFLQLHRENNVILQIGGSDQWGNILSGIDLINKICKNQTFGLTTPLLTQSNGVKFGKTTTGKTIWLDSKKTSPYSFYQFWLNIKDDQIINFLKFFTFLSISKINKIKMNISNTKNNYFYAKSILASYITKIIHGKEKLNSAKRITNSLFFGSIHELTELDFEQLKKDGIFSIILNGSEDLRQTLMVAKLSTSRSDSFRLIISNSICINNRKEKNPKYFFCNHDKLFGKYTILSKGKKNHVLLCW